MAAVLQPITMGLAQNEKFGVVRVLNKDGTPNRAFKVDQVELLRVQASGNDWPAGVTQAEWEYGLTFLEGKAFNVGDMLAEDNGTALVKLSETIANGQFLEGWLSLAPGEYSGKPPAITVAPAILTAAKAPVQSIVAGSMTLTANAALLT